MKPMRILLADDHTLVRAGIRSLLEQVPNVEVVAEAYDGRDALRLVQEYQPDLVFMDVTMQGLNGLDATAQITKTCPGVQVIMLSMHKNEEYVSQALRVGAAGYLLKDAATAELVLAVQAVARGATYLSPAVSKHVVARYLQRVNSTTGSTSEPSAPPLTVRQREILQLIAEGHTTKQIASLLHLSTKTVETHRSQLMDRLGIRHIAGLVRYAVRTGLVAPDH